MIIYIIRHGETDWNRLKRFQGQSDIPLNENGIAVARKTAEGMKDIRFDRVISSPLIRAVTTARIIIGDADIPFETDERIKEISFGDYEGRSTRNPDYMVDDPDFAMFQPAPEKFRPAPNGESFEQLIARTGSFLEDLRLEAAREAREGKETTVLVSVHGCCLRALLANIRHTAIKDFWGKGVPRNCAVSIAQSHGEEWRITAEDRLYADYENS